jgi:alanine racemase
MPAEMQHPARMGVPASLRPTWYEIDLGAIAHNTRELRRLVGKDVAIYGCLKRNAYGCGAAAVARTVMAAGGDGLAVGNIDDAVAVRRAGVAGPILLYPTCLPDVATALEANDLIPTISTPEEAFAWAAAFSRPRPVFLKVDVGLFRAGAMPADAPRLFGAVKDLSRLIPAGLYSHFYSYAGEASPAHYRWQFETMVRCREAAAAAGLQLPVVMVSSTTPVLDYSDMDLSGVDPGRFLYGVQDGALSARGARLRPAFRALKTRLVMIKPLGAADTGGHPPPFPVASGMLIGILPLGWGDGIPRPLPPGAAGLIGGRRAPLLNPVHLEHLRIDLTNFPCARPGDEVVLIGRQGDAEISLDEVMRSWRIDATTFHANLRDHIERRYVGN